jgi:hypothetical protein
VIRKLAPALYLLLACQSVSAEDTTASTFKEILDDFTFSTSVVAEVGLQSVHNSSGSHYKVAKDSFFQLSQSMFSNRVHLSLALKLEELFAKNSIELNNKDFSWQEFVKNAKIEIREIFGAPVAIIIGKQKIPFANKDDLKKLGDFDDHEMSSIEDIDEVMGLSLRLTPKLLNSIFKIDLSAFESKSGDLEIGKVDSYSIRLSKSITDDIEVNLSHARIGNKDNKGLEAEERTVLGIMTRTYDDMFSGWIHGIHLKNNLKYPKAKYGLSAGAMFQGASGSVIVEYNWLENTFHELGAGINMDIHKNLAMGVSTRYRKNYDGSDVWITGIELKVILSNQETYYQESSIFSLFEEDMKMRSPF